MPRAVQPAPADTRLSEAALDSAFGPVAQPADPGSPISLAAAKAAFQAQLPRIAVTDTAIIEGKEGKRGYSYKYADLAPVSEVVLPALGRFGLSFTSFPTVNAEGRFVLRYKLEHESGQFEGGEWPLPNPGQTDPKAVGSAITYARRYSLLAATGVAVHKDDDDAAEASDAAERRERFEDASDVGIPPAVVKHLTAVLDPEEPAPPSQIIGAWAAVMRYRAAVKPSPIEHDGRRLTWAEAFGMAIANTMEAIITPEGWRQARDQLREHADLIKKWPHWQGLDPSDRFTARGKTIAAMVASRQTEAATERADEPAGTPDERDEHWRQVDEETAAQHATPAGEPAAEVGESPVSVKLMQSIYEGIALAEVHNEIEAAFLERGEISGDEHAALHAVLANRPEPGPDRVGYDFLCWQAECGPSAEALDKLSVRAKALHAQRSDLLDAKQYRDLTARISARRTFLKGERYR